MTRWTSQDAAKVAGLRASGLTHAQIAQRTGIPRRTVTAILGRTPVAEVVTSATREQVSAALWQVVAAGTEEALRRIRDPKTRAGEIAALIKVAAEQHALLTGDVTGRWEQVAQEKPPLDWEQERQLRQFIDAIEGATDEELEQWATENLRKLHDGFVSGAAAGVTEIEEEVR